jgi:hypothetical protein
MRFETPRYVIVGLFEVHETSASAMALQSIVEKFGPIHKVIPFVRDEGNNLGTMAITL